MKDLEILAPVGSKENFYIAINNGADAVYLGLKDFNARDKAENFNVDNIKEYVDYAHVFGVKVYVTINIIITDNELPRLIDMVRSCIKAKVDAFIVQDLGVAYLLKNTFKNIVLHASTQMGIHNLAGAKMAEKIGFKRIVVSRETSKEDIIEIKNNTNLEIEYFVQGALCVCFSGNCYYSSLEKNESGNRGRCLQLCRLPHTALVEDKKVNNGYLLSTTDLCLIEKLKELRELGICSLKIEGRLRRSAYVGYTTRMYKEAKNASQKNIKYNYDENDFKKIFYRGEYNKGIYLNQVNNKNIINPLFQNHRGILIGRVLQTNKFKDIYEILICTNGYEINKNDGLKFVYNDIEQSIGVGSVKKGNKNNYYLVYSKTKPIETSEVFLTVDSVWESKIEETKRVLDFDAYFEAKVGKKPVLKLKCGNVEVCQVLYENCDRAISQGLTFEQIKSCLEKLGSEPFKLKKLNCNIENVFIVKSQLNELRRKSIEILKLSLIKDYESKNITVVQEDLNFYERNKNFNVKLNKNFVVVNENTNVNLLDFKNFEVVFSPSVFSLKNVENFLDSIQPLIIKKIYLDLPKVLRKEDFEVVENLISNFSKDQIGIVANNIYALMFLEKGYDVIGGVYLNIANCFTAKFLNSLGVNYFVKSFEHFANDFANGLNFVGKPALMTFCHCPYKTAYNYSKCEDCKFTNNLVYKNQSGKQMNIRRIKIKNCYFELSSNNAINMHEKDKNNFYLDLRE